MDGGRAISAAALEAGGVPRAVLPVRAPLDRPVNSCQRSGHYHVVQVHRPEALIADQKRLM